MRWLIQNCTPAWLAMLHIAANPRLVNAFSSNTPQSICGAVCSISMIFGGGGMREECEDLDMPIEVCYAWNSICHVCREGGKSK